MAGEVVISKDVRSKNAMASEETEKEVDLDDEGSFSD